jgi:hypothetical protein
MLTPRARPVALPMCQSARRRRVPRTRRLRASSTPLHAQVQPLSVRRDSRTPWLSPRGTLFVRSSAQERNATPLFSSKRAPSRARLSQQLQHSQSVADSFTVAKALTLAFPAASPLSVRSWSRVQQSTLLLSWPCALFGKSTREGGRSRRRKLQPQLQLRPSSRAEVSYSGGFHCGLERSPAISTL